MRNRRKGWRLLFIPLIAVGFIVFGYGTMYLWNALMPEIFHLPLITFWQAIGLLILSRLLLGIGSHHKGWAHHNRGSFRERMRNLNPEERKRFFNHFNRCCPDTGEQSADNNGQGKQSSTD